eukprot:95752-Hanusia_phi.AAC.1
MSAVVLGSRIRMITASKCVGRYSAFLARWAMVLKFNLQPRFTVATTFLLNQVSGRDSIGRAKVVRVTRNHHGMIAQVIAHGHAPVVPTMRSPDETPAAEDFEDKGLRLCADSESLGEEMSRCRQKLQCWGSQALIGSSLSR